jgi:hypothetical protein
MLALAVVLERASVTLAVGKLRAIRGGSLLPPAGRAAPEIAMHASTPMTGMNRD